MKVKVKFDGEAQLCNIEGAKGMSMIDFKKACKEARGVPDGTDLKANLRVRDWAEGKNVGVNSVDQLRDLMNACPEDKPFKVILKRKTDEEEGDESN